MDTSFYRTKDWRDLRILAIRVLGITCGCCKHKIQNRSKLHVDHVVPRSKDIALQLTLTNLQVLCEYCNCTIKQSQIVDYRTTDQVRLLENVWDDPGMIDHYPTIEQLLPKKKKGKANNKRPKPSFHSHADNIKIVYNLVKSMTIINNGRNDVQNVVARIRVKYSDKLVNKIIKQMIVLLTYKEPHQQYSGYLQSGVDKILHVQSRKTAVELLRDDTIILTNRLSSDVQELCG